MHETPIQQSSFKSKLGDCPVEINGGGPGSVLGLSEERVNLPEERVPSQASE